jgi:tetratricopeptide (TPR) repeat protein
MKSTFSFVLFSLGISLLPMAAYAQEENEILEEESAAVFLEEYTDEFQELFFEGLKQKGIQNYDKAINAFLSCIDLAPDTDVITYELAKTYLLDKQYISAEQYAIASVNAKPENYWYADTMIKILEAQKKSIAMVKEYLPWDNNDLKTNVANVYYEQGNFLASKNVLKEVKSNEMLAYLESKINDSIAKSNDSKNIVSTTVDQGNTENSDLENYKTTIDNFIVSDSIMELLEISQEALDNFPSQPYFYYAYGVGLNRNKKWDDAIENLETALDYVLNNVALENKIYGELASVYTQMNDPEKANMYLSKMKPGF